MIMAYALLSHPAENNAPEKKLTTHLLNVAQSIREDLKAKNLSLKLISPEKLERIGFVIGLMHDLGKATFFFQKYLRGEAAQSRLSRHSLFSATACCHIIQMEFDEEKDRLWAYAAFHVICRHHGNLIAFDMLSSDLSDLAFFSEQRQSLFENYSEPLMDFYVGHDIDLGMLNQIDTKTFRQDIKYAYDDWFEGSGLCSDDRIEFFFIVNLLFSLLIDFDKSDAARLECAYFKGNLEGSITDIDAFLQSCREKEPDKFDISIPINQIRNDFLTEIQSNTDISKENYFYSITAPTGIGKTFGCMAFAEKLKQKLPSGKGRIVYCLPYTSIIDQNHLEFENIINHCVSDYSKRPNRYLLKHHCLTQKNISGRILKENYEYKDYLDDTLFTESWQSAVIVTTFVQFFHSLIGHKNRFLKKFHNIVNAIVILDEVQNINPDYHQLLKQCFTVLGERFHIYFVLVTATQPEILDHTQIIQVVQQKKYMTSDVFNRVRLVFKPEVSSVEEFAEYFIETFKQTNALVVMNTIKAAQLLYSKFKTQFGDYSVYCLTTRLIPLDRNQQILEINKLLKKKEKVIVVSTQLIEAGVDLSFQNVYRDFGPMDSIVQVAGRCNRHGEYGVLGGEMVLLNLNNDRIYKPSLLQYANETIDKDVYESRDFLKLSESYFSRFNFGATSRKLLCALRSCNYDQKMDDQIPVSDFKLIEEQPSRSKLFILTTPQAQSDMESLFASLQSLRDFASSDDQKAAVLLEIEILKYRLNQFAISVYQKDLITFKDIIEPHEIDITGFAYPYKYISYENQSAYAYDLRLGFCAEPKTELSGTMIL